MGRMLPLFTAISLSVATTLQAETLEMPAESASPASAPAATGYAVTLPGRGMNMTQVEEKFGPPLQKLPEVGEPPIIRWVYPSYTVYFEYQFVINSILNSAAGAPPEPKVVEPQAAEAEIPAESMPSEEPMASPEDMPPAEIPSPFEGVEIISDPEVPEPMPAVEAEDAVPVVDEEGEIVIPGESP